MIEESNFLKKIKPSIIRELFDKSKELEDVVSLGIGEPEKTTPKHIISEAKKALDRGLTHYTSNWGISELRKAIAEKYENEGINYNPKNEILITCGGYEALFASIHAFIDPGDNVVVADPSWVGYVSYVNMCGGNVVSLPHLPDNNFCLDLDALGDVFNNDVKMMILNSPSNPTGYAYTKYEIQELVKIAQDNNTMIIFDEVYEIFIYDGREHVNPAKFVRDDVIVVNSFSKSYAMTGWRVGYVAAEAAIAKSINKVHQYTTACANTMAQYAAVSALKQTQEEQKAMIQEYNEKRRFTVNKLNEIDGITCSMPAGTFYAFPKFEVDNMGSFELSMYLLEKHKVVVIPGVAFGKLGENHIRVSYAASFDEIKEGLKRLKLGIESLR